jgi:O-antigen/teichoic acid export membrane protein
MGIVFVPIYLRYIGAEGYGLVGFFTMIIAVLTILDGGFGAAASRELALAPIESQADNLNQMIHSLEVVFWGLALILGIGLIFMAPWIVDSWLNLQHIGRDVAEDAVRLMGAALVLQWPAAYYRGCIVGLQKQIGLNAISAAMATARSGGAAIVLWGLAPTIRAFFAWQVVASFVNVVVLRSYLWRTMPAGPSRPIFNIHSVRRLGNFAAAVGLTNVFGLVLSQMDKIILSKVLPLSQFGYYTLAATLSGLIYQFIGPVFNAFYPRITHVVSLGRNPDIARLYHLACQTMAISVIPVAMLMVFFGKDMVWVWTGNSDLAANIQWVIALLAVGTMCNGLMTIPYALQLANAWTHLALRQNIVAVCLLAPLIYIFATRFGLLGAAAAWPLLNLGYIAISAPIMYRRLLSREMSRWYIYSVFLPVTAAAIYFWVARVAVDTLNIRSSKSLVVIAVIIIFIISFPLLSFLMPEIRLKLFAIFAPKQRILNKR